MICFVGTSRSANCITGHDRSLDRRPNQACQGRAGIQFIVQLLCSATVEAQSSCGHWYKKMVFSPFEHCQPIWHDIWKGWGVFDLHWLYSSWLCLRTASHVTQDCIVHDRSLVALLTQIKTDVQMWVVRWDTGVDKGSALPKWQEWRQEAEIRLAQFPLQNMHGDLYFLHLLLAVLEPWLYQHNLLFNYFESFTCCNHFHHPQLACTHINFIWEKPSTFGFYVCAHNQCDFSYVHKPSDMNLETRPLKQEFATLECALQISPY